jgi:DNA-binding winged helix-turn-helix (wHTH) protein/tetratricopeptide (TPR) repeat protein
MSISLNASCSSEPTAQRTSSQLFSASFPFFWYFSGRFPAAAKSLSALEKPVYRFGGCELDPQERRLLAHGQPVTLTPKVFDTLVLLVERAGHAVSKDELMTALWPRGFVDESNLTKHIWLIRKALGDGEHEAKYIETVAKVGYRFVAPVQRVQQDVTAQAITPAVPPRMTMPASAGDSDVAGMRATSASSFDDPRGSGAAIETVPPHSPRRSRVPVLLAVAAASMLALLMVWRRPERTIEPPKSSISDAVAIVEFSNLSQNPKVAWLGPALEEMLATEVGVDGRLQVVADELVRTARVGLATPTAGGYAPQSLATLRKRLNAGFVLSGGYLVAGSADAPQLRLDLSLQSTRDEALRANFARNGALAELPKLVADAGAQLRGKLGIAGIEAQSLQLTANAQPPSAEVARRLGFALDALHKFDAARARDELLDAVAQAPGYAPAYAYLARAWSALGYKAKALAAAEQAVAHAENLPEEQRAEIDAQLHAAQFDWPNTVEAYRKLVELRPQNSDYRLQLIDALLAAGKPVDAEAATIELRKLPDANDDARVELASAKIAADRDNTVGVVDHAKRALVLAQSHEQAGLVAAAELQLGIDTSDTKPESDGDSLLRRAAADYQRIGNPHGEAQALQNLANRLLDADRLPEAREEYQRAMATYQSIGDLGGVAAIYSNMSRMLWTSGDRDGAETALRHALDLRRETADLRGQAWALTGLATLKSDESASDEVADMYRQAIALDEQAGDHGHHVFALAQLADVLRVRGDLLQAQETCEQMLPEAAALNDHGDAALTATFECGQVALDRGDVDAAVARFDSALAAGKRLSDPAAQVNSEMALAQVDMAHRQWQAARGLLLDASEVSRHAGLSTGEADAEAALALCEQALGDAAAREKAAANTRELLKGITERGETFEARIALAELDGLTGKRDASLVSLRELAVDAQERQWVEWSLDARLSAVNVLAQVHDPAAVTMSSELEADARKQGFGWVVMRLEHTSAGN